MSTNGFSQKPRVEFIDYAKALSMVIVLCLHNGVFSGITFIFFLPMFFIASGMLFNDTGKSYKETAIRYVKKLMIPFWTMMLIFTVCEMVRAPLLGYGDYSIAVPSIAAAVYGSAMVPDIGVLGDYLLSIMSYKEQSSFGVDAILPLSCHMWFLPAMFIAQMVTLVLMRLKKNLPTEILIILLLLLSFVEYIPGMQPLPYCLTRGLLGAAYMFVGIEFKRMHLFEENRIGVLGILMICAGAVTVIADSLGTINTLWIRCIYGPYGVFSGILAFVAGVCSSYFVLNVCRFFEISLFSPIKKLLSLISIHSMTVYLWHLLIFNVIYALYTMVTEEKLSPDPYMMNLITQSSTLFRFAVVIITAALLAYAGLLFSRFKNKVY